MRVLALATAAGLVAGVLGSGPVAAQEYEDVSTNIFLPPHAYVTPSASALVFTAPSADGIPYRWWATMDAHEQVSFGYYVGARSWWEPTNPPATPGWTHNSNWVALTLTEDAWVTIWVGPDVPVPCAPPSEPAACDATGRTGSDLYPAISLYSGHDTTSPQDHVFNPVGNGWWSTIEYRESKRQSNPQTHVLYMRRWLPAGDYTINIGGAGAKSPYCDSTMPCYSGGQSYRASITTHP